jgi:hypothetical protein
LSRQLFHNRKTAILLDQRSRGVETQKEKVAQEEDFFLPPTDPEG